VAGWQGEIPAAPLKTVFKSQPETAGSLFDSLHSIRKLVLMIIFREIPFLVVIGNRRQLRPQI
jgi:hypothetical protein